jgi:hypothetical protein
VNSRAAQASRRTIVNQQKRVATGMPPATAVVGMVNEKAVRSDFREERTKAGPSTSLRFAQRLSGLSRAG